uniref:Putative secreted protein n=1 Tax=Ixodes ricinus TaxID=34613 RepID=A0A6B0U8P5_IXORI
MGCTPLARQRPPKRLLKIWLNSRVAVALLVISTPAASPSKMRLRRSTGWLCVEMSTPAWALRKMSFSSSTPLPPLKMQTPPSRPS